MLTAAALAPGQVGDLIPLRESNGSEESEEEFHVKSQGVNRGTMEALLFSYSPQLSIFTVAVKILLPVGAYCVVFLRGLFWGSAVICHFYLSSW